MIHRKYDHGHVEFGDGREVEFGFTSPTKEELEAKGMWNIAAAQALTWANDTRDEGVPPYTEADIVRLRLAG
jgi:hypothetical protein